MVFLVFFDPKVIPIAWAAGDHALSALSRILRGFCHNCLLAEVDGWQVHQEIRDAINELPEGEYRIRLQKLFVFMAKQNRFADCLSSSEGNCELVDVAFRQGVQAGLDCILSEAQPPPGAPETTSLARYELSNFERDRSCWEEGLPIAEGVHEPDEFLNTYFRRLLEYASEIVIMDAILGRKFDDHFQFSLVRFVKWLESISKGVGKLRLRIHTEADRADFLRHRLSQWVKRMDADVVTGSPGHERYLFTNQGFAITLGRGCDFFDQDTGRNRKTTLGFVVHEGVRRQVS